MPACRVSRYTTLQCRDHAVNRLDLTDARRDMGVFGAGCSLLYRAGELDQDPGLQYSSNIVVLRNRYRGSENIFLSWDLYVLARTDFYDWTISISWRPV